MSRIAWHRRLRRGPTVPLLALALMSFTLNVHGLTWGLPNGERDWANDSIAPLGPLYYVKQMIAFEPWVSKYPPMHYMVLAAAYAPYAAYLRLTGGLGRATDSYPYGFRDPETALMFFTLIARFTSALMGVAIVLITYHTARRLYDARAGFVAATLVATAYPLIHYAHNANVDTPQLFWIALALYCLVALLQTARLRYYVLVAVFAAFAIGTKPSAYALFVGVALIIVAAHVGRGARSRRPRELLTRLVDRPLLLSAGVFCVAALFAFNLPFNWEGFLRHLDWHLTHSVPGHGLLRRSTSAWEGHLAIVYRYVTSLVHTNGLPAFFLLAGGTLYCLVRYPRRAWIVLPLVVAYHVFFLRVTSISHVRFLLPVYLVLTWGAGKLASDLLRARFLPRGVALAGIGLVLLYSLGHGASAVVRYHNDARYSAERWMEEHLPRGAQVFAANPDYAQPRFPRHVSLTRGDIGGIVGIRPAAIAERNPQFVIINLGVPIWRHHRANLEAVLDEMGYRRRASFSLPPPVLGPAVPEIHSLHPNVVVFERATPGPSLAWRSGSAIDRVDEGHQVRER